MTVTANASYNVNYVNGAYEHFQDQPRSFAVTAKFETAEEAAAFVARFPKFVGLKLSRNVAHMSVALSDNNVNKGKNEAGIKRIRKFLELAGTVTWRGQFAINAYATQSAFESAL